MPDHVVALELVRVTEAAALAAGGWVGRDSGNSGKVAATAAVREAIRSVSMCGVVVIGEDGPTPSTAPAALLKGAEVGSGSGPPRDVGLAIGDGALSTARDVPHALTAIAVTERSAMYNPLPALPLRKLAVGSDYADVVDIDLPVAENLWAIAAAKGVRPSEVTVAVLDRPRNRELVCDIRDVGARIHAIEGGEIAGTVAAAHPENPVDILLGTGGAEEGVLAAAALYCLGGALQARLCPADAAQRERARLAGYELDRVLHTRDLVRGERTLFCATGVTGNELLRGVGRHADRTTTESIVLCADPATTRTVRTEHRVAARYESSRSVAGSVAAADAVYSVR